VALDERRHLGVQPARVPELDRGRPGQVGEQQLQELEVALLGGRELEQDRPGALAQGFQAGAERAGGVGLREAGRRVGQRSLGL